MKSDSTAPTDKLTDKLSDDVLNGRFNLIPISDTAIFAASSLIDRHHVNSADAAGLKTLNPEGLDVSAVPTFLAAL